MLEDWTDLKLHLYHLKVGRQRKWISQWNKSLHRHLANQQENVDFPQDSMTFLWIEHLSETLSKFRHFLRDLKTLFAKNSLEK